MSFREARALANAGRLLEAADLFEGAARAHPHHEIALVAADFSLDTVNRASHQRPACAARIGALAVGYSSLFGCGSPGAPEERCERFEQLRCEALRVEADWLAERDPARASETYERVHRTGCARNADQALYNAAVLARRADDPARADALIEELRRAYPESPLLPP